MNDIGTRLYDLRTSYGLTQSELAIKTGVSRGAIGNYEKGIRRPEYDALERLADFFNVSTDYLFGRVTEKDVYKLYHAQQLNESEDKLLEAYRSLNDDGKSSLMDYIGYLCKQESKKRESGNSSDSRIG